MVDTTKTLQIESDASEYATGSVLSMLQDNGKWHPCAYLLKGFNDTEHNYDVHNREMMGIICALKAWQQQVRWVLYFFFFFWVDNLYTAISKYMCSLASRYQLNQKTMKKKMGRLIRDCPCPRLRQMRLCTALQVYPCYLHSRGFRFSPCPKAGRGSAPTGDCTTSCLQQK